MLKSGDRVTIERCFDNHKFDVLIQEVIGAGFYGYIQNVHDVEWTKWPVFFNTVDQVYGFRFVEPHKPVYMEDGVVKFNTSSLFNKGTVSSIFPKFDLNVPMPKKPDPDMSKEIDEVYNEFLNAWRKYGDFASFHEGYAVLLEEVDELWDHVKVKEANRDKVAMKKEIVQISAMALKMLHMFKEV